MSDDGVLNHSECEALPSRMTIEYFNQFVVKMGTKLMYLSNLSENSFQIFHQKLHRLESALTLIEKKLGFGGIDVMIQDQRQFDQTWSDCSTIEYYNLTKFGQDWTKNKNCSSVCKILAGPLLKFQLL